MMMHGEVEVQHHAFNWALDVVISFMFRATYNKEISYRNTQIRKLNF
jgi:hypothetical protein